MCMCQQQKLISNFKDISGCNNNMLCSVKRKVRSVHNMVEYSWRIKLQLILDFYKYTQMTVLYEESHSLSFTKIRIVIVFVQISSVFIQKSIHKSRLLEMFKYKMSMYEIVKSLFFGKIHLNTLNVCRMWVDPIHLSLPVLLVSCKMYFQKRVAWWVRWANVHLKKR